MHATKDVQIADSAKVDFQENASRMDLSQASGPALPVLKEGSLRGVDLRFQSLCNVKITHRGQAISISQLIKQADPEELSEVFKGSRFNHLTTRWAASDEENAELLQKMLTRSQSCPPGSAPIPSISVAFEKSGMEFVGQTSWSWWSPQAYSEIEAGKELVADIPVFGSEGKYFQNSVIAGHDIHDLMLEIHGQVVSVEDFLENADDNDLKQTFAGIFWTADTTRFFKDDDKNGAFKRRLQKIIPELSSHGEKLRPLDAIAMGNGYHWDDHTFQDSSS